MRFHLLDNGMAHPHGHHDHFARGFLQAMRERGCGVEIYAQARVSPELREELGAKPVFGVSQYIPLSADPFDGPLADFLARRRALAEDLKVLDGAVGADDVLLLPTATPALLAAVQHWREASLRKPRIAALFHSTPEPWAPGTLWPALYRNAAKPLIGETSSSFWVGATNQALAARLRPVFGRPVNVMDSLTWYSQPSEPLARDDGEVRVGFIGTARKSKGGAFTPEIVRLGLERPTRYRFIVQTHGSEADQLYLPMAHEPRLEVHSEWLDEDAFVAMVRSLDMVVLPYERERYKPMVSGVLAVAAGYGVPCVAPTGTWMADQIEAGLAAGISFRGSRPAAVVDAIDRLTADLAAHRQAAAATAPAARERFSIDRFADRLTRWVDSPSKPESPPNPSNPRALICCYHKTGTVLFNNILQRAAPVLHMSTDARFGLVSWTDPDVHATLIAHSLFDPAFELRPWHRVVRIVRDPRDIWLSSYLYHRRCSEPWCVNSQTDLSTPILYPRVDYAFESRPEAWKRAFLERLDGRSYQQNLLERDQAEGLQFELEGYTAVTLEAMRAWRFEGPQVQQFQLEQINADFDQMIWRIFSHIGFSTQALKLLRDAVAMEDIGRMDDAQLAQRPHVHSRTLSKWRQMLTADQVEAFEQRYGHLILDLGYELSTAAVPASAPVA